MWSLHLAALPIWLLAAGQLASQKDSNYKVTFSEIEERHFKTIRALVPVDHQSALLSKVKSELNLLEDLFEGAYMIGEITAKLSDKIVSFGELLSSYIISEYFIF